MDEPKTLAQFRALPVVGFGQEDVTIEGKVYRRPVPPDLCAFYAAHDTVMEGTDLTGHLYRLARSADGRWCRRLVG